VAVWRSGPVFSSLEPTWDKAELNIGSISHGDLSWPIRISVWFYKQGHADTLLGVCETTVDKLLNACMGEDDDVEEVSEKDLILTRLNNEGKEVVRGSIGFRELDWMTSFFRDTRAAEVMMSRLFL
jgi:hypothetical protein